jgi:hypothetical protein
MLVATNKIDIPLIKICEPTRSAKYDIVSDDDGMDCDTSVKKTIIVRNCDMQNPIFSPLSVGIIIESVFRNIKTKNGTTVVRI